MKKLTAYNDCNERAIEGMFGKAMCAYANWMDVRNADYHDPRFRHEPQGEVEAACQSEYEATVRCLAFLVKESVPEICMAVIEAAKEEFGI